MPLTDWFSQLLAGQPVLLGATWPDAASAVGTSGAVIVALWLARRESRQARKLAEQMRVEGELRSASLISAWVESHYEPSTDGTHYIRRAIVHLANESDEPAFHVKLVIGFFDPVVRVGPLSVPDLIPVLPPRTHRQWDITLPLLSFSRSYGGLPRDPVAETIFTDARGKLWIREFNGELRRLEADEMNLPVPIEEGMQQIGPLDNPFNPIAVVLAFMDVLQADDPPCTMKDLQPFLDDNAPAWRRMSIDDMQPIKDMVNNLAIASHTYYWAERVAYVRLVPEELADQSTPTVGRRIEGFGVVTLTFKPATGWRIFSIGGAVTQPDWIEFPRRSLLRDATERPSA